MSSSRIATSTRPMRVVAFAMVAGAAALGFTVPVSADHSTSLTCDTGYGNRVDRWEHDRGYALGKARGRTLGYADGLHGRPYCAPPAYGLSGYSPSFRQGYRSGFGSGYAAGFSDGRRACGHHGHGHGNGYGHRHR